MKFAPSGEPIWKRDAFAVILGWLAAAVFAASSCSSSLRSRMASRCFWSSISLRKSLLSPPAGAVCASASPAKGSSAAMLARRAARRIFTISLLIIWPVPRHS